MDTSLRIGGDAKYLRLHAKQKLPIDFDTHLQLHGEVDTRMGSPRYFCAMIRHFFPEFSACLGAGAKYSKQEKLQYTVCGKKSFPVTSNGLLNFIIKGQCDVDKEFKQKKSKGGAELTWSIFDFQKDQDVRIKVGYEVFDQVAYMQIRENNWSLNGDMNGKWSLRFDL